MFSGYNNKHSLVNIFACISLYPCGSSVCYLPNGEFLGQRVIIKTIGTYRQITLRRVCLCQLSTKILWIWSSAHVYWSQQWGCHYYYHCQLDIIYLNYFSLINSEFSGGSDSKESACNEGDLSSILWLRRYPGEGHGNPLQYSCLENSMNKGCSRAADHVVKSQTWRK